MSVKQIEGYSIFMNKILGKGSYGSVYVGKQDNTGVEVAVKILSKDSIDRDEYLKAALKNQIEILQKLHSDNIVGFYDVMESSKNYYIIQELCDGDLSADIKPGVQHPEELAVELLRQICNGFLALVKEGIIHRDLKPANVMKKAKTLKLGDFGFAKKMGNKSMVTTCVGTPLYMSLQILKGQEYTSKCDIWALGFIFYEILHGETPWIANTETQLVRNIQKQPLNIKRKNLSAQTEDFLRRCLKLKENERMSWDQIFVHPIFRGYFLAKSDTRQFQNKIKMIMNKLRFYISQKNLDMKKVMDSFGFGYGKEEITYQDFYHFFLRVYPEITNEETDYVFKKTDADQSGTISVDELKSILTENGIKIQSQFDSVPTFQKRQDGKETFKRISADVSLKIKSCFQKLYKIINKNNLTLWKVFNDFDKKKGSLNLNEFSVLMKKICSNSIDITEEQIRNAFELIDEDGSNSIEFAELDKYYSKINGVLESGNQRYEPMQIQHNSPPKGNQRSYEQPYQQPIPQQQQMQQQYQPQQYQQPQYQPQQQCQPQQNYQSYQQLHQAPQNSGYMNFSQGNNGNMNIPMGGGYNYPPNNNFNSSYPPVFNPNMQTFPQQNPQGFNPNPNPNQYNTVFNPFDILGKRM